MAWQRQFALLSTSGAKVALRTAEPARRSRSRLGGTAGARPLAP